VISRHRWSDVGRRISPALASAPSRPPTAAAIAERDHAARRRHPHRGGRARWHPNG
jgi:hypothetical protein